MTPVDAFFLMVVVLGVIMALLLYVLVSEAKHKETDHDRMS